MNPMSLKAIYICLTVLAALTFLGWQATKSSAYESAEYDVLVSESPFEVREYPDLTVAATTMGSESQRDSGSFMRLFRYISGANDGKQKIAMTTPVFMEAKQGSNTEQMGFVLPKNIAAAGVPEPSNEDVSIKQRAGGNFAVMRFKGRMNDDSVSKAERSLRDWMKAQGYVGEDHIESAGYDPPWTPGFLRRNEVLVRLKTARETEKSDVR
jgi:DNA gyrase inhibitor GyrI